MKIEEIENEKQLLKLLKKDLKENPSDYKNYLYKTTNSFLKTCGLKFHIVDGIYFLKDLGITDYFIYKNQKDLVLDVKYDCYEPKLYYINKSVQKWNEYQFKRGKKQITKNEVKRKREEYV